MTEYFFHPLDRLRMDSCVNGLSREGMSLIVHCPDSALLSHYSDSLIERIRTLMPQSTLEAYFPTDAQALIDSFNKVLTGLSLNQAMKPEDIGKVERIWVVYDAQALPANELHLLGQLIQQFPGANIRTILMLNGPDPTENLISAMGRRIMQWNIALPSPEQAQALWLQAHSQGHEAMLRPLFQQLKIMSHVPMAQRTGNATLSTKVIAKAQSQSSAIKSFKFKDLSKLFKVKIKPNFSAQKFSLKTWKWPFVFFSLLLISTGLMAWLQPAAFGFGNKTNAVATAEATSPLLNSEPNTGNQLVQVNTIPEPPKPNASTKSYPALMPPPNGIELPGPAVQGQLWAQRLEPNSFFIQHGTFNAFNKAEQMHKLYAGLNNSQIIGVYRPGESLAYFILATGPHSSLSEANEFLKRKDIPSSSWIRSSQNLQDQLNPSVRKN
jgi:hypothetical protein